MLDFILLVHEILLGLTLHVRAYFENLSVLVICCLIEIGLLLAVPEWERE